MQRGISGLLAAAALMAGPGVFEAVQELSARDDRPPALHGRKARSKPNKRARAIDWDFVALVREQAGLNTRTLQAIRRGWAKRRDQKNPESWIDCLRRTKREIEQARSLVPTPSI